MRGHFPRLTTALLTLVMCGSGLAGVADAAAAPANADTAATTCIGGAIWRYTSVSPTTFSAPGNTAFTTSNRCLDINMRKSTEVTWDAQACVIFVDHTASCNYWTDLSTSWKTIATNVADNTHFKVMVVFDWPNSVGTTAVQLAF